MRFLPQIGETKAGEHNEKMVLLKVATHKRPDQNYPDILKWFDKAGHASLLWNGRSDAK